MTNPEGTPIWYELLTPDHDASKKFYDHVIGWNVHGKADNPMDYRMIETADGGFVGGVMQLTPEMKSGGAKPTWLFYIGVDDVDASFEKVKAHGGGVLMPPFDIPGAGRAAMVTDPQGAPFHIMRGSSDQDSTAYERMGMGKCNWNELSTSDQPAANKFYGDVFGWNYPDKMSMGDMGDYIFIAVGDTTIGATMTRPAGGPPPSWQFYFRTPDIEATAKKVGESGGTVHHGPVEVPGGDRIIIASDLHGTMFGAVGPGE